MVEILQLATKKRGVATYVGTSSDMGDSGMEYFLLQPPPARKDFHVARGQGTVDNVDDVLRNVEKVELCEFDLAVDVFGTRPSKRHVSLYIGKPLGKFF